MKGVDVFHAIGAKYIGDSIHELICWIFLPAQFEPAKIAAWFGHSQRLLNRLLFILYQHQHCLGNGKSSASPTRNSTLSCSPFRVANTFAWAILLKYRSRSLCKRIFEQRKWRSFPCRMRCRSLSWFHLNGMILLTFGLH